ncbi:hypothetical protein CLU96_2292 [Chryseobacterium sp. 52]|nr:hypothetical protein CLU96_2292 [Chryseobacterium sp. 52]
METIELQNIFRFGRVLRKDLLRNPEILAGTIIHLKCQDHGN